MSRMKHLLRKLHIGSGLNDHQRFPEPRPEISPSSSAVSGAGTSTSSTSSGTVGTIGVVEPAIGDPAAADGVDFSLLEEEFQMQLALAISASEPETAQIDAAKRISLAGAAETDSPLDSLSFRYWSYNVVNYDEKILDGFYDVHDITSKSVSLGAMPSLIDLQRLSASDNISYEAILVNRLTDYGLQELEKRAYDVYLESRAWGHDLLLSGLIQKLAEIVASKMGGPVDDAEEMLRLWNFSSCKLRNSLNTVILPLGCLDVGLSRHRALLFKVLADRVNLPCMLVKGSYYTGTDDGAVNLIRIDHESEFIIDLMSAPGTLIPAEVPSCHFPSFGSTKRSFAVLSEASQGSFPLLDSVSSGVLPILNRIPEGSKDSINEGSQTNTGDRSLTVREVPQGTEDDVGKLSPSVPNSVENLSGYHGKPSSAHKRKVKSVSQYVISAAKDPEFAQKLHAVLKESGASPPPDLFLDINSQNLGDSNMIEQASMPTMTNTEHGVCHYSNGFLPGHEQSIMPTVQESLDYKYYNTKRKQFSNDKRDNSASDTTSKGFQLVGATSGWTNVEAVKVDGVPEIIGRNLQETQAVVSTHVDEEFCQGRPENSLFNDPRMGRTCDDTTANITCTSHSETNTMLGEVGEWEIPWEDLQIGERIGIGSYGEVYHAEWNGTEVAVKKFLDQDFSGEALVQFRSEVEIMLRLRHPNVVLFMGAVTRPPHFSILTEFLPRGSLYKLLHRPNFNLDEKRRMKMALDVAKGMNYLHTSHPTIVHRDLKSPNLLVDKNWVVKVGDFGLSRMKHHTFLSSKSTAGTPEWMAPEVLRNERANEKCDVYSFGVILWELVTSNVPWKGLNPMQVVGAVGFQNRRLEIPDDVDPAVAQIIRECWQTEPHLRPSFAELMSRLRRIQRFYAQRLNSAELITE